jgi:orotidine-5'-phosphate decarboxylase
VAFVTTTPIVALDMPSTADALAMVDRLDELCGFYKVGATLFTAAGPRIVGTLVDRGAEVFLDLKYHDIPNTVAGAVRSASGLGVRLLTVHAAGGEAMLKAAVAAAGERGGCGVLAVTVLTSLDATQVKSAWGRTDNVDVAAEVLRLAGVAAGAEAFGVVCSGHEAAAVRKQYESLAVLVPGVRMPRSAAQDQARVVTPTEAAAAGARYIVVGRAVTQAPDPRAAMSEVLGSLA